MSLQLEHTADVRLDRVRDPATGLDTQWFRLTLTMVCVWNPFATATATRGQAVAPLDPLGVTLANLKDTLLVPRQQVTITLGPDRVIQAPINDGNGVPMAADPDGGPTVNAVEVRENLGDKSAIVWINLTLTYNPDNHAVESHRWSVRSETDGHSRLTTRVVEGWAVMRMDYLYNASNPAMVPDQLRAAFVMKEPDGFFRKRIHVEATPDGQRLHYVVIDQQNWRNLGARAAMTRVTGDATAGVDWPFHDVKTAIRAMGNALGGLFDVVDGRLGAAVGAWGALIPTTKCRVIGHVKGHAQAELADLVNVGINACLDRFAQLSIIDKTLIPVSVFVGDDLDNEGSPNVQVKMEFLAVSGQTFRAMLNPKTVQKVLNLAGDVKLQNGQPLMSRQADFGNPRLPASNGTRGHWISFLVSQVLATGAVPVANVPVDGQPPRQEVNTII